MRVMVAMSGGVDSSVAAALLARSGHEVVGATLKLWGGESDSGCCSVADVEDARRVAGQLGIAHHVFDFTDAFENSVVRPYVDAHADGLTPNPCIECNRHVKFGRLLDRVRRLGFGALATGHHARVRREGGSERLQLVRGADPEKDQSYVLSMLTRDELEMLLLPVGEMRKSEVRALASELGLRTAAKPDSQDVCFIDSGAGRKGFLEARGELHPGTLIDNVSGAVVGSVPALELITVGQRRGLGVDRGRRRYALRVDPVARSVVVGDADAARAIRVEVRDSTWVDTASPPGGRMLAQTSAHGPVFPCTFECTVEGGSVVFDSPQRLVAPGQTVALYDLSDPDVVLGGAIAA